MSEERTDTATFGGGCFWCLEAAYKQLRGVMGVESGYAGGDVPNPSYRDVTTGRTGHAEVVRITFDPAVISYRDLLEVFFTIHDPTTPDRQGADIGSQYRSIILYHSDEQRQEAEEIIDELEAHEIWPSPIVTQIVALDTFHPAEDYHRDYYRRNPDQAYCQIVISPKLAKLRAEHQDKLRSKALP